MEHGTRAPLDPVLAVPGSELVHPAEPDWWSWVARWASNEEHIDLAMTLFDTAPRSWGGFTLGGRASAQALLTLYSHIHAALPGGWLHNAECELHTAESFGECMR